MISRIIFIGGGNMAEAIFSHMPSDDLADTSSTPQIVVTQRNPEKHEILAHKYPTLTILPDLNFVTTANDIVIIATKPQDAKNTCENLKTKIKASTIISIMTGITVLTLDKWLDNDRVARVMPNTPSAVGLGVSGIYFSPTIITEHQQIIDSIFKSIGKTYIFPDEDYIDKITAVSGSSPAYIFYFIECLINTAIKQFGFDENIAKEITLQVVKGSLAMIENNIETEIGELRKNVTSKKGTTEQAIQIFETHNLAQIIRDAEIACYNRAKELSKN
jgi:pyrroline-5-carboxylate reductase